MSSRNKIMWKPLLQGLIIHIKLNKSLHFQMIKQEDLSFFARQDNPQRQGHTVDVFMRIIYIWAYLRLLFLTSSNKTANSRPVPQLAVDCSTQISGTNINYILGFTCHIYSSAILKALHHFCQSLMQDAKSFEGGFTLGTKKAASVLEFNFECVRDLFQLKFVTL